MRVVYTLFYLFTFISIYTSLYSQKLNPENLLSELLKKESITGNEKNVGQYLIEYCKSIGLHTRLYSDGDSTYNFSASLYPLSLNKPNIIFLSHIDVVPYGDLEKWKYHPSSGTIEENCVWGRGAIDCKGLAVMQLNAITNYIEYAKNNDLKYNITFLAVSGEETQGYNGSEYIVNNHLKELNPIVVYGEGGSGMRNLVPSYPDKVVFGVSVAEKKALWLKIEAHEKKSGHGAVPSELYANKRLLKALIKLLDEKRLIRFGKVSRKMFKELGKLEGGMSGFIIRKINWDILWPFVKKYFKEGELMHILVYNTFVITNLYNQELVTNKVADKAFAILDCRLLPETNSERFLRKIENVLGPKIDVTVLNESPGAEPSDYKSIYFENIEKAIIKNYKESSVVPILFPATTDNNYFRVKNIPTYGILPVIFDQELIETVHSYNERIKINDLYKGSAVFTTLIDLFINE